MENLKLLLRRRWYWFLLYALCYSGITTLVIYRFPMVPLLPLLVAFLPLLLIPVIYFGTLLWLHFRRHSLNRIAGKCTGTYRRDSWRSIRITVIYAGDDTAGIVSFRSHPGSHHHSLLPTR